MSGKLELKGECRGCGLVYEQSPVSENFDSRIYCGSVCSSGDAVGVTTPLRETQWHLNEESKHLIFNREEIPERVADYVRENHPEIGPFKLYPFQEAALKDAMKLSEKRKKLNEFADNYSSYLDTIFPPIMFSAGSINQVCPDPSVHRVYAPEDLDSKEEGVRISAVVSRVVRRARKWIGKLLGC